jgi:hypothetical protein
LKILKTALMGDIKLWWICHCRRRLRRSRSIVEKKSDRCKRQIVSRGKQKMDKLLKKKNSYRALSPFVVVVRSAMLMWMGKKK